MTNKNMNADYQGSGIALTLGGVPWIRGGVPVIVVDTPMTGDDDVVVMMVGDTVP